MNRAPTHNRLIAITLLLLYLLLPAETPLHAAVQKATQDAPICSLAAASPCDTCPCSGNADAGCCYVDFCPCSCPATLFRGVRADYSPLVVFSRLLEPPWSLPQVYRPIFVPPQNSA
ncbi:hypothetical protein [Geobacter sp. SVR]|uniref:hypothetical protein n=1 Tax=Geobacter sp. SVR TaxID=2495594 RepID=UPI00156471D1|nr:hypothetical protein [Geobacter sp. SVR]